MKGPIFHKLLYRLSREQRKQFFGEGFTLNKAVEIQDNINKALDDIFYCCPNCNDHRPYRATGENNTDNLRSCCSYCGEETISFGFELVSPQEIQEVVFNIYGFEKKHNIEHVHDILAGLRAIPEDLSISQDGRYFTELVSGLFHELKCILDDIVEELTCQYERFEIISFKSPVQDGRRRIRTRSGFLFKQLPDFSGCEDEAGFNNTDVKSISSFNTTSIQCSTIKNLCSARLIPLSNLRMTG